MIATADSASRRAAIAAGQAEPLSIAGWIRIGLRAGMLVLVVLSTFAAILVGELQRRSKPGTDPLA